MICGSDSIMCNIPTFGLNTTTTTTKRFCNVKLVVHLSITSHSQPHALLLINQQPTILSGKMKSNTTPSKHI